MTAQAAAENNAPAIGQHIHIGGRSNLEDRIGARTITTAGGLSLTLAVVADGMGGHQSGEVAAEITLQAIFREMETAPFEDAEQILNYLKFALEHANKEVFDAAQKDRAKAGMGTTATAVAVHAGRLYLAHVGDSRAYLIRDGQALQLTEDHTWAREMVKKGVITEEEAVKHPKAEELVHSIGNEPKVQVDLSMAPVVANGQQGFELRANDRVVLCSDGLIKQRRRGDGHFVEDEEMAAIVRRSGPQKAAEALVKKALSRQVDDNVSAIVLEAPGSSRALYVPPALIGGIVGGVVVIALAVLLLRWLGSREPDAPAMAEGNSAAVVNEVGETAVLPTPTDAPTVPAGQTVDLQLAPGDDGMRWENGTDAGNLSAAGPVPYVVGQTLLLTNGNTPATLTLPDGAEIWLNANAELRLLALANTGGATATRVEIQDGAMVLVQTSRRAVEVINNLGDVATASGDNSLLGVVYAERPYRFQADCLAGSCRYVSGTEFDEQLSAGQAFCIFEGCEVSGVLVGADYPLWASISTRVPTPTPTPSPTSTPTPTPTKTPPPTRRRDTPTPAPVDTVPAATATPGSGGGTPPEPPKNDTPTPVSPTPVTPTEPPPSPTNTPPPR